MAMRGKWLIEVAEMWAMSRAEAGRLKAFLSQTTERFVPKYGHKGVLEPRQCLFMGTTNKKCYLRDETGARRFWPLACTTIDMIALRQDRDQLFAEAVLLYRKGEQWWPDADFEREHIQPQQDARYEADPWEDAINEYLEGKSQTSVLNIAKHALGFDTSRIGPPDRNRITAALDLAGWERGTRTKSGVPWVPKAEPQSDEATAEPDNVDPQAEPGPQQPRQPEAPGDLDTAGAELVIALFRKAHQHFKDRERANLWMTTRHPALGMRKPEHLCQEPGGTARCLDVLKATA
jgi:predicted P-loop ATPase